jgi:hypothetical protein
MADLLTGLNAQAWIGPVADDAVDTEAEFIALTPYVAIGMIETIGEFGDTSEDVTANVINEGRTRHAKGTRDAGTCTITCFWKPNDPGQQDLMDAEATSNRYAIKISPRDRLTPAGTDSISFFRGLVRSARRSELSANEPQRIVFDIGVDSAVTYVPAA